MDTARCTLDGVVYHAHVFAGLPLAEIGLKRQYLECAECKFVAYFRKAATSGQDACFGARPHADDCSSRAQDSGRTEPGGEEQDILNNPGEVIVLDLNFGAQAVVHREPGEAGGQGGNGGRYVGHGQRQNARSTRRLRPILRNLVYSEQFRNSTQTIEIPDRGPHPINIFFVGFLDIKADHINRFRGYWGVIFDAKEAADGGIWLNTGRRENASVLVPSELKGELLKRYKINALEDFSGQHLLVLGTLNLSAQNKRWIKLEDVGFCALYQD